jgi:chromosome segregation ATPase
MTNNDELVSKLQRILSYSRAVGEPEQEVLKSAIAAIRTPDHDLSDMAGPITTASALLEMLTSPAKYKAQLNDLNNLLKSAREERAAVAAERAALASEHAELEPKLKIAMAAHERLIADRTADFDKRVSDFQKSLSVRSDAIRVLEEKAKADAAEAARLKEELQKKLDAIRTMAA